MDFKFWGAAPGGFFENPTIFGVFGLKIQENSTKTSIFFSKNQKKNEKFPVGLPGYPRGLPGATGKILDFSKILDFFFNFPQFSLIFPQISFMFSLFFLYFKTKSAKNRRIFEEPARSRTPALRVSEK